MEKYFIGTIFLTLAYFNTIQDQWYSKLSLKFLYIDNYSDSMIDIYKK